MPKFFLVAVVLVLAALPVGAAPASIDLQASCGLAREEIVLTWSADNAAPVWTVIRDERIIATVAGKDPQADVLYTYRDPGSGGEYTVSGGNEIATITIHCPPTHGANK